MITHIPPLNQTPREKMRQAIYDFEIGPDSHWSSNMYVDLIKSALDELEPNWQANMKREKFHQKVRDLVAVNVDSAEEGRYWFEFFKSMCLELKTKFNNDPRSQGNWS